MGELLCVLPKGAAGCGTELKRLAGNLPRFSEPFAQMGACGCCRVLCGLCRVGDAGAAA